MMVRAENLPSLETGVVSTGAGGLLSTGALLGPAKAVQELAKQIYCKQVAIPKTFDAAGTPSAAGIVVMSGSGAASTVMMSDRKT